MKIRLRQLCKAERISGGKRFWLPSAKDFSQQARCGSRAAGTGKAPRFTDARSPSLDANATYHMIAATFPVVNEFSIIFKYFTILIDLTRIIVRNTPVSFAMLLFSCEFSSNFAKRAHLPSLPQSVILKAPYEGKTVCGG